MTSLILLALFGATGAGAVSNAHIVHAASSAPSVIRQAETTRQSLVSAQFEPQTFEVSVTAYTSSPEETDDTPFLTASGTLTRDGVLATNLLPFGTKVKIPSIFGDKVFTVEDRMHPRKVNFVDVWMPTKEAAYRVGIRKAQIVIVDGLSH